MKLNGLTNNLKGNDKSLSNSYLSHIVELLRKELDSLEARFNELDTEATEHIETQKTLVKTVKVEAESINDKINFLTNAIEMFGSAKLNGHNILTDETFQGPFAYKGEVAVLPETANAGDVYICDGKVSIYNGTSYDSFIIPVGMVSKAEYDADQVEIKQDISTNTSDIAIVKEDVTQLAANVGAEISKINTALADTVNKNPVDEKVYVRKNDEWVELSEAANTVKEVAGESSIRNEESGVVIASPKVEINSEDIRVNGTTLTQADKFALSKTNKSDDIVTYYELQYKQKPIGPFSSTVYGHTCLYNNETASRYSIKSTNNQKWTVTTRDYQYCKQCDSSAWGNDVTTFITSLDREGNIKQLYLPAQQLQSSQASNLITDWIVWNPEFCPEGFENKAYLFFPWCYGTDNRAAFLEYDNGDFVRSYDMTKQITDQGGKLQTADAPNVTTTGAGGKALRNKDIQRICWIAKDASNGGTYAVIFGGDKNSKVTDPFDPSKCIYIKLPATACPGYTAMAATDKAWYVSEYDTGRIMRITPDGQVTEYNLSVAYKAGVGNYIEYTDKNGKPACAFRLWDTTSTAKKEAICFFEEKESGNVNFEEVSMSPYTYAGWDSNNWRMMENDYYIFFTAGYGFSYATGDENSFPSASTVKKLFYWDKATHTTHIIDDLYGLNATWDNGNMSMYKTKEKAIWIVPHVKTLTTANRTGEFKYILNRDYTNIDEATGKDTGAIEVQTATIGTNHPWFTCNDTTGYNKYIIMLQDSTDINKSALYYQYACVNDDGIGFLMSPDYKAYALFYGEGNIKVYECSDKDTKSATYDPSVQQLLPDELGPIEFETTSCEGLKHGWLVRGTGYKPANGFENMDSSGGFRLYVGLHYKNGEPTILERPTLTILRKHQADIGNAKHRYDYYSYLLTYDDYERRNKVMRGIFKNIMYGRAARGIDSYYEEVEHKAKKKLNLLYDNKVISSVDD